MVSWSAVRVDGSNPSLMMLMIIIIMMMMMASRVDLVYARKSSRILINAPVPPYSLSSLTSTSVCEYSVSNAADDDLPSDTTRDESVRCLDPSNQACDRRNRVLPNMAELRSSATAIRPEASR